MTSEPEQPAGSCERGHDRPHECEQQDEPEVGEEAFALRVKARVEDDGWEESEEEDLRVQPHAARVFLGEQQQERTELLVRSTTSK